MKGGIVLKLNYVKIMVLVKSNKILFLQHWYESINQYTGSYRYTGSY